MRGKKAKAIRKRIYGDHSPKKRRYATDSETGQIICVGLRAAYRRAKAAGR